MLKGREPWKVKGAGLKPAPAVSLKNPQPAEIYPYFRPTAFTAASRTFSGVRPHLTINSSARADSL